MLINQSFNSAQPSFKATLKQNECLKRFVDDMYPGEYKTYKKTVDRLANISKGDELEIYKKKADNWGGYDYFIHNPKKKDSDVKIVRWRDTNDHVFKFPGDVFNNVLKEITMPDTSETRKLLTEPAQKDPRGFWEKLGDALSGSDNDPTAYRY